MLTLSTCVPGRLRRVGILPLLGIVVATGAGCVAVPFATPPARVTVSPGIAFGDVLPAQAAPEPADAYAVIEGRAAIEPLGLVRGLEERTFDFSVGYLAEVLPQQELLGYTRHGAFVGLTHHPYVLTLPDSSWATRLGITAMPELLVTENDHELGGGMTFCFQMETFSYAEGDFEDFGPEGGYAGAALGEGGIGFDAGGGVRGVDGLRYWTVHLGLVLRLPATGGVAAMPAWALLDALD